MGKSFKKVLINDERDDFLLEVRNLSKRYGEKQAIDSISFSIEGKQAVGFLGINGAGKTTTMNILTGYLSASDGDVIIDGIDVLTDPLKACLLYTSTCHGKNHCSTKCYRKNFFHKRTSC